MTTIYNAEGLACPPQSCCIRPTILGICMSLGWIMTRTTTYRCSRIRTRTHMLCATRVAVIHDKCRAIHVSYTCPTRQRRCTRHVHLLCRYGHFGLQGFQPKMTSQVVAMRPSRRPTTRSELPQSSVRPNARPTHRSPSAPTGRLGLDGRPGRPTRREASARSLGPPAARRAEAGATRRSVMLLTVG